jgi:hypothetical protein
MSPINSSLFISSKMDPSARSTTVTKLNAIPGLKVWASRFFAAEVSSISVKISRPRSGYCFVVVGICPSDLNAGDLTFAKVLDLPGAHFVQFSEGNTALENSPAIPLRWDPAIGHGLNGNPPNFYEPALFVTIYNYGDAATKFDIRIILEADGEGTGVGYIYNA